MSGLRILVVGGGGREHALAWKLAQSKVVEHIFVAPGNAGTHWDSTDQRAACEQVAIEVDELAGLIAFAQTELIDLTVVGPEAPLADGIVDRFQAAGLRIFGPTQAAAQIEASKAFSKDFMRACGVPTAAYGTFDTYDAALDFIQGFGRPVVVKADGLAAGKGVIVCDTTDDALDALRRVLIDREFGRAGGQVIVEERLEGVEVSAMAFCDGETFSLMPAARDHKRIFDGDQGANTGGMGAFTPVPDLPADFAEQVGEAVIKPILKGMIDNGTPYVGVLYAGLMLTPDGLSVLEFNCRFGDPETQVILPLLESDLVEVINACIDGALSNHEPVWSDSACATVVLAAPGYPGSYPKGLVISGLGEGNADTVIFQAGTSEKDGGVVTAGGRVLSVSAVHPQLDGALKRAYQRIQTIHFDGMQYRRDIGRVYQEVQS